MTTTHSAPFRLSATLTGHSQDVKSLKFISSDTIYSCARDTTARIWKKVNHQKEWTEKTVYQNSNPGFLNAVAHATFDGQESILTAGQDSLIQIWPANPPPNEAYEPRFVLAGHTSNVCCLDVTSGNSVLPTIYSGSWDCTAIVWRRYSPVYVLKAHSAAVWAVLALGDENDSVLTGAADNLIMLWKLGKSIRTFKGHTQAVRALVRIPQSPDHFASAGNDATVRIWSIEGEILRVMDGHDSFIYSLDALPTGELVSSGEDRMVRIWDSTTGQLSQTITVPAISVWTVSACKETGDFVCGSSDSMIRVFTRSEDRLADPAALAVFEDSVKTSSVSAATIGDVKKSDLPSVQTLLARRGKKEGEVAMAKNETNGAVEAYQWDGMKGDWLMVGTVVDGIGSSRKQLFDGREYDYVFDVDIKDGVPPLKLPYNVSDNPYTVAQKWLAKHELPETYVDQVVEFIDKNTSGVSIGGSTAGADPFTGTGSYRPGNAPVAASGNVGADPFTGAGSYRPGQAGGGNGGTNPWTGSSNAVRKSNQPALLPHKNYLTFPPTNLNFDAVTKKIRQFSSEVTDHAQLSESDFDALQSLTQYLAKPVAPVPDQGLSVLEKMASWPLEKRFPALDLLRMLATSSLPKRMVPVLISSFTDPPLSPPAELNITMALRALNNGLAIYPSRTLGASSPGNDGNKEELAQQIIQTVWTRTEPLPLTIKLAKVALATTLLNLSVMRVNQILDDQSAISLVGPACDMISNEVEDEVVYRTLIAVGNLLSAKLPHFQVEQIEASLKSIQAKSDRITLASDEIRVLVHSVA
ncbi:hypothetical protein CROQUDRAFT_724390 [Cronartium quercuum f. sp. fusiforme G11]|uniref:Phospholipase A-2-activating protein n=1 Tax=Cronartium quercuum f. sp. fusiforme G11 TaxID=708437 RepID=A0A9P6T9M2_9BASI|nr:hypothetical protein CROQUDRAFT_724390 [Cronartium quercuum f. sp. fusiforme G11]